VTSGGKATEDKEIIGAVHQRWQMW
jgi:hypothetical protein